MFLQMARHFKKINYFSSIFQILENDDLSKAVCNSCINGIENVRAFFQQCFNANQELIISLRKSRPCPLDLPTHINQYVRSFNPPIGKMEYSVANSKCENLKKNPAVQNLREIILANVFGPNVAILGIYILGGSEGFRFCKFQIRKFHSDMYKF